MPEQKASCHYCGCTDDGKPDHELRPYGPGGAAVCFPCAMKTPARKAETKKQTHAAFDAAERAAGPGGIVEIGSRRGLRAVRAKGRAS